MKVAVRVLDRQLVIELPDEPGTPGAPDAPALIDRIPIAGDLVTVRPGLYSLVVDGRSYEVAVEALPDDARSLVVTVDGTALPVEVEDERQRARRAAEQARGVTAGRISTATIVAPMPGRVVSVLAAPGDTVERGQTIVTLEAMKMESSLTAPHTGTVTEVLVTAGQTVQQRQPLVRIEG